MSKRLWYKSKIQKDAYTSSWSFKEVVMLHLWQLIWLLLYRTTPKHFFNSWRLLLLIIFGANVKGTPFVFSSSRVFAPWLLSLGDKSCLGPHSEVYNLGPVVLGDKVTISQYCYICNGTHDLALDNMPLMIGKITIGVNVFIGAKALILPGIAVGDYAVIGAGSVVTKDVEPWTVVGGNPAKFIKKRIIKE